MISLERWQTMGTHRQVRNRKLFVVDLGPREDAAPLLLIHGFPTSSYDFSSVIEALPGRRVVALDLLGFGLSDKPWPHDYSLLEQTELFLALLGDLKIKRAHLIAHDMGDTIVQELLGRRLESASLLPFEIASVTLLNGGVLIDRVRPLLVQRLLGSALGRWVVPALPSLMARRTFDLSLRRIAGPHRPPTSEELDAQYQLLSRDAGQRILPYLAGYMRERHEHAKRWRRALLTHPFPMRLIWGDADPINPWSMVDAILSERPTTQTIRLRQVGHYPHLEAPGQVACHLLEFVDAASEPRPEAARA